MVCLSFCFLKLTVLLEELLNALGIIMMIKLNFFLVNTDINIPLIGCLFWTLTNFVKRRGLLNPDDDSLGQLPHCLFTVHSLAF